MAHTFSFLVTVEVNRTEGKFAPRDDIADELRDSLSSGDPGSLTVGEGEYEVTSFDVSDCNPEAEQAAAQKQIKDLLKRLERIRKMCTNPPKNASVAWVLDKIQDIATLNKEE